MGDMGQMCEMYRDWNAIETRISKERSAKRKLANDVIIKKWIVDNAHRFKTIRVRFGNGTTYFRIPGKPSIDFSPTKNEWRKGIVVYYGDANKFLNWYEKQ